MKSRTWIWTFLVWLFAALAIPAQATVVFTPVNMTLPTNGSYPIDLNHDGITDFSFQTQSGQFPCPFLGGGPFKRLTVQPAQGGIVGTDYAAALLSGVTIDFRQSFYRNTALMYFVIGGTRCPLAEGNWVFASQRYLGLEFQINGQTHYGWAELTTIVRTGLNYLYGFAYETIPGKAIKTGQTMDSPDEPATDSGSAESSDPGSNAPAGVPTSDSPQLQSSRATGPAAMAAQDNQDHHKHHHQYKLIDLGTFGGPTSFVPAYNLVSINSQGTVIVEADTSIPDPYSPNCFQNDCLVNHAGTWQDGVLTDLGTLPGVNSTIPLWINDRGVVIGVSENGLIDPLTAFPETDAVVWKQGHITDLGTLGGNASVANAVNNRGQVVGGALNMIPDPFSGSFLPGFYFFPVATQSRAFFWQDGAMRDLGTLGGPDSVGEFVNERGQVAGASYTSFTPNPGTGVPTQDPFLWDSGTMIDLGTLGGTVGFPEFLNNRGQVAGQSNLADDVHFHAFLWSRGVLTDLGTLGGDNSSARWVNDAGEVVGRATLYPGLVNRHGFLWKKGVMTDLGILAGDTCSTAYAINSSEQIVGDSGNCGAINRGFLVENGDPIVDLQTLVLPGSDVTISETNYINDAGEISGFGTNSNGDQRAIVLIPCDEKHPGECEDYSMIEVPASQTSAPTAESSALATQHNKSPADTVNPLRNRFGRGNHLPGQPTAPAN